jgi:hypothetical protein
VARCQRWAEPGHLMAQPMESVWQCSDCKTVTPEAEIKEWKRPHGKPFPICPNCKRWKWPMPDSVIPGNYKSMSSYGRHATCKKRHCQCEPCPETTAV